jgi:hypothetical protein
VVTLQELRTGGCQTVTVQHVNVASGGQAVVGNVRAEGAKRRGSKSKMSNAMHSAHAAPRCGAHARTTGQPCKAPAIRNARRCRMHGAGLDAHPHTGGCTKAAVTERRESREALRLLCELIDGAD